MFFSCIDQKDTILAEVKSILHILFVLYTCRYSFLFCNCRQKCPPPRHAGVVVAVVELDPELLQQARSTTYFAGVSCRGLADAEATTR